MGNLDATTRAQDHLRARADAGDASSVRGAAEGLVVEGKLREAQRLEGLCVLVGGIAHDFNNLMTAVLANAARASSMSERGSALGDAIQQIRVAGERAATLSASLLACVGRAPTEVADVDFNKLVGDTARIVRSIAARSVVIVAELADEPVFVRAAAAQLSQVVMNLVMNGAEAIGAEPGAVRLGTSVVDVDGASGAARRWVGDAPATGRYARLRVADTGSGMNADVASHIFDPFFSTKSARRGFGLSSVLGIVRSHGGFLALDTNEGRGTIFEVLLPLGEPAPLPPKSAPSPVTTSPVRGRVLFVDDEPMIRRVAQAILLDAGFDSDPVEEGDTALARFAEAPGAYCAVIIDHTMPGLRGDEVIRRLRSLRPGVPVVHASGFRDVYDGLERLENVVFLPKPYDPTQLILALREALGFLPSP